MILNWNYQNNFLIEPNGSRLGEVAEHKTSLVVQTLKFR
jgi:hypothetical protein